MIILLSGKAGFGKDTCCDYICKKHRFLKIAYADKIKRILSALYDFEYKQLWGPSDERSKIDPRYNKEIREFIQAFGDKGRELNIDTWVNYAIKIIDKIHNCYGYEYVDFDGLSYSGESSPRSVIVS